MILLCRHSWHMQDVVKIIKRLRWGQIGYANLRYRGYTVRASHVEHHSCDHGVPSMTSMLTVMQVTARCYVPATGLGVRIVL